MPLALTADQIALLAALAQHGSANIGHRRGRFFFANRRRFRYDDLIYLRSARLVVSNTWTGTVQFSVTEAGHRYLAENVRDLLAREAIEAEDRADAEERGDVAPLPGQRPRKRSEDGRPASGLA